MCGRYALRALLEEIEHLFAIKGSVGIPARYNIAPRQPVLIVRNNQQKQRELAAVEWGLVPEWKKEIGDKPLINARVETVEVKPSFRSSIKRKRCLVPFDAWYEWKPEAGRKQPYVFEPSESGVQAFAGIWSTWHGPGGDHWLETMAILTAPAIGHFKNVHHRRPLVVRPDQFDEWLQPHDPLPRGFLNAFDWIPETTFQYRAVGSRVSNVRFDDPSCLEPAMPEAQHSLF
ncbi:SOS response-associated peptidase [Kordiimonas aquimaris]|uniref:SOS response-associated peptidase n=1 Tax=Kordiimonas aquimaris TaxID=707591 RepID=UPI0021D2EB01|nr:SOS response-associated peptidase [Kordiimonas aquimaris]